MVAEGKIHSTASAPPAAANGATTAANAAVAGDGLREETLLQQKLARYATSIGKLGLGAAVLATLAMAARFRHAFAKGPAELASLASAFRHLPSGDTSPPAVSVLLTPPCNSSHAQTD